MTNAAIPPLKGIVLTVDDVRRWKWDLSVVCADLDRLTLARQSLENRLNAASMFIDVDAIDASPPADTTAEVSSQEEQSPSAELKKESENTLSHAKPRRRRGSELVWADVILEAVRGAEMGLTYQEMRQSASHSSLGHKMERSLKGYHNAISRLAQNRDIIREHGRLFTPEAFERFETAVDAGKVSTQVPQPFAHSPMGEAILDIVGANPGMLNGKGVITALRNDPEHNATLTPHETGAYNIIARLVRRQQIIRRDDGVLLPGPKFSRDRGASALQRDGALNGITASAPSAGEEPTSPIDNQHGFRLVG